MNTANVAKMAGLYRNEYEFECTFARTEPNSNIRQINYQLMFDLSAIYLLALIHSFTHPFQYNFFSSAHSISLSCFNFFRFTLAHEHRLHKKIYGKMHKALSVSECFVFVRILFDLSPNNELYVICQCNTNNFSQVSLSPI